MTLDHLRALITAHGYLLVGLVVALESTGVPLPGETTLITAAILAGSTHELDIRGVIAAAAAGAIAGDNVGFWLGRRFGHRLLIRYGPTVGIGAPRIKLGQYLFARYGGAVVFFGRFVAILRALAAVLAGANCMPWGRFLLFNAAGGVVWAGLFGMAAYSLGREFERLHGRMAVATLAAAAIAFVFFLWVMRRHEADWTARAEAAFPGPPDADHSGCG